MGPYNPRNSVPNNGANSASHKNTNVPIPQLGPQPFINIPNQFVPMQNNQMGFPMSAPVMFPGQAFPGFLPQFNGLNMNNGVVFPANGPFRMPNINQMSLSQPAVQFQNLQNFAQLMNQNMGIPNGQLGMQNMNQFCSMQMANLAQLGSFNTPVSHQMLGSLNQGNPGRDPQNPAFFGTSLYGAAADGGINPINMAQPSIEQKELPNAPEKPECNSPPPGFSCPANEGQALGTMRSFQGNSVSSGQSNMPNSWKHSPKINFRDRPNNARRWENQKFTPTKNAKRKFDGSRDNGNRGGINGKQRNSNNTSLSHQDSPEPKRSISVSYTEQEIQQWRDQRRKNHPSRANKDELQKEKLNGDESIEREEKLRREQLKEVLAKQAELGVEVADIPLHYLMDSENQEANINETDVNMTDRSRNRRNKQGKNRNRNQFSKRQHISNDESSNETSSMSREPTLLQKLLSADIKRDKHHLLQVFRFIVMNNLLKDGTDKPLEYPIALVKDTMREVTTLNQELLLEASASIPGILTSDDFAVQDCDHESLGGSKVVNWNCGGEAISTAEEGEIIC